MLPGGAGDGPAFSNHDVVIGVQALGKLEQRKQSRLEERVQAGDVAVGDLDDRNRERFVASVWTASIRAECRQPVGASSQHA